MTNCELTENIRKLIEESSFAAVLTAVNLCAGRVADDLEDGIEYRDLARNIKAAARLAADIKA